MKLKKAITRFGAVSMYTLAPVVGMPAIAMNSTAGMSVYHLDKRRDNYDYHYKARKHKEATVFPLPALQV
jgi:hypothetical protein